MLISTSTNCQPSLTDLVIDEEDSKFHCSKHRGKMGPHVKGRRKLDANESRTVHTRAALSRSYGVRSRR